MTKKIIKALITVFQSFFCFLEIKVKRPKRTIAKPRVAARCGRSFASGLAKKVPIEIKIRVRAACCTGVNLSFI